jgi:hypothetical protein
VDAEAWAKETEVSIERKESLPQRLEKGHGIPLADLLILTAPEGFH